MAERNRIIYQNLVGYVGPSPATGFHLSVNGSGIASPNEYDTTFGGPHSGFSLDNEIKHLTRLQSADNSWDITRIDVNQFGQLAAIDRTIVESPTVTYNFSYLTTNGVNEKRLGFVIDNTTSAISGLLSKESDEKNYFLLLSSEGSDALNNLNTGTHGVIAIGNGFITDYTVEASVGGLASSSVSVEALNFRADLESSGNSIPAIDPTNGTRFTGIQYVIPYTPSGSEPNQPTALKPGDITLNLSSPFGAKVSGEGKVHLQNFNLNIPIAREAIERLGSQFAFSREITFPVTVTLTVNALATDFEQGGLDEYICEDADFNVSIEMREPSCAGEIGDLAMRYELKNAKLDSQSFSASIGDNATYDLSFSAQIGGPEDTERGLFMSGSFTGN